MFFYPLYRFWPTGSDHCVVTVLKRVISLISAMQILILLQFFKDPCSLRACSYGTLDAVTLHYSHKRPPNVVLVRVVVVNV